MGVVRVLLTTEGTYPVAGGGVSTWCDLLVRRIHGVEYTLLTILANPYLPSRYHLPAAIRRWVRVPLWGTEDPMEHQAYGLADRLARQERTTRAVVREGFLPPFRQLVDLIWSPDLPPGDAVAQSLVAMHRVLQDHDYVAVMKHPDVWEWYAGAATQEYGPRWGLNPSLQDLVTSLGWLYRFLAVLAVPVPPADVTHASAASLCAVPGVIGRLVRRTPLLLTEHGVYLREQYGSVGKSPLSPFQKRALIGLVRAIARAAYHAADVVAPVAAFNIRWERELGVPRERIRVVYNGVDPDVYQPRPRPEGAPPTVVSVARIDPIKDIATLLRAAAQVARTRPDVRFVLYGGVSVPSYYQELLRLRRELGLEERFVFAGHTADVPAAYNSGDVVALSSVSEGFPYAVVEAMMCGKPVVATDVGGTREALGHAGVLVPPRAPAAMAAAILWLLDNPAVARAMGEEARERALALFTIQRFVQDYQELYQRLSQEAVRQQVRLALVRARALVAAGLLDQAGRVLAGAARQAKDNRVRAALLLELAAVQVRAGDTAGAALTLARAEALAALAGFPAA